MDIFYIGKIVSLALLERDINRKIWRSCFQYLRDIKHNPAKFYDVEIFKILLSKKVTSRLIATTAHVLATLKKRKFNFVFEELQDSFINALTIYNFSQETQGLSNILWSLATLEYRWELLPEKLQTKLLEELEQNCEFFNSQEIANSIWALAHLQLEWIKLPESLQKKLLETIEKLAQKMSSQEVGNSLWALARMDMDWEQLSALLKAKLSLALIQHSLYFNPQEIANVLWAFWNMNVTWNDLHPLAQTHLIIAINANIFKMNAQEVTNLFATLIHLNLIWNQIPHQVQEKLLLALEKQLKFMNATYLTVCMRALARLECQWSLIPEQLKAKLLLALEQNIQDLIALNTTDALWSLAVLGVFWDELSSALQKHLLTALGNHYQTMRIYSLASSMWALARMGACWTPPADAFHKMAQSTDIAPLANFLWALTRFNHNEVNDFELIQKIFDQVSLIGLPAPQEDIKQIVIAFYYFKWQFPKLQFTIEPYDLFLQKEDSRGTSNIQTILIKSINEAATETDILLKEEFLLCGFMVDSFCKKNNIVLEIDGPHHGLRKQQMRDQLQNKLLSQYGYTTLRLKLESFNYLNDEQKMLLIELIAIGIEQNSFAELKLYLEQIKETLKDKGIVDIIPATQKSSNAESMAKIGFYANTIIGKELRICMPLLTSNNSC